MMEEDITVEESRQAMDTIISRARDFEERSLAKEILTVDNHCDGVYLYLKALKENNFVLAEKIKALINLPSITPLAMCGNENSGIFGQN